VKLKLINSLKHRKKDGADSPASDKGLISSSHGLYQQSVLKGIGNYSLFQQFPFFLWPAWLGYSTDTASPYYRQPVPPFLNNNTILNWISFTNFLSDDEIRIDPTGMLSPSYALWSVELWIKKGDMIFRPQADMENVIVKRDTESATVRVLWEHELFTLSYRLYGARLTTDEAVIDVECFLKGGSKTASLLFAVRPYNITTLGGIDSVEYLKDKDLIEINNSRNIAADKAPDYILTGNSVNGDISGDDDSECEEVKSSCPASMATMALGYDLEKGESRFVFRMGLCGKTNLTPVTYDHQRLLKEFSSYSVLRLNRGFKLNINDNEFHKWFNGSKIGLLNLLKSDISKNPNFGEKTDFRTACYVIMSYNRMGYFQESLDIINSTFSSIELNEKNPGFDYIINCSYFLSSIADYFVFTRNLDYIRSIYKNLKRLSDSLCKWSTGRMSLNVRENSIANYFVPREHFFDRVILSFALGQFSYLSRCLGIFGDEKKFLKESEKIADDFINYISKPGNNESGEFFYHNIFSGYPFSLEKVSTEHLSVIIEKIKEQFGNIPIHVKSLGWDIFSSIVVANNLLRLKDPSAMGTVAELMKIGQDTFVLPDYINPVTGKGVFGNGDSRLNCAVFFLLLRNLIFIDTQERLDLFPIPDENWFKAGTEIIIEDAPSRFGIINFKVVSTASEIKFYFETLPKFVPPDIMITLPFKTKIQKSDDFIVKKKTGNSYIINGWPSIVKFLRKQN